jgi:colanic acid/amylovoran biosynthesis protein
MKMVLSSNSKYSQDVAVECYLEHNLGDDLFLKILLERYPNINFFAFADKSYLSWDKRFQNFTVICSNRSTEMSRKKGFFVSLYYRFIALRQRIMLLRRAKSLVIIGGSIFMQFIHRQGLKKKIKFRFQLVKNSIKYYVSKKVFICGSNFGPFFDIQYKNTYHSIFNKHCNDICFRDRYSFDLFNDLNNVRYAPDILFGAKMPLIEKKRNVFFSVVDLNGNVSKFGELSKYGDSYDDWLLEATKLFHNKGYHITYCSFCSYEGDMNEVIKLSRRAEKDGIKVSQLFYYDNIEKLLEAIAESEIVVGTRFHATILGLVAKAKVIPILYSDKTKNVLEDMNFDMRNCIDLRNFDKNNFDVLDRAVRNSIFDVSTEISESVGHFSALDAFLKK